MFGYRTLMLIFLRVKRFFFGPKFLFALKFKFPARWLSGMSLQSPLSERAPVMLSNQAALSVTRSA